MISVEEAWWEGRGRWLVLDREKVVDEIVTPGRMVAHGRVRRLLVWRNHCREDGS